MLEDKHRFKFGGGIGIKARGKPTRSSKENQKSEVFPEVRRARASQARGRARMSERQRARAVIERGRTGKVPTMDKETISSVQASRESIEAMICLSLGSVIFMVELDAGHSGSIGSFSNVEVCSTVVPRGTNLVVLYFQPSKAFTRLQILLLVSSFIFHLNSNTSQLNRVEEKEEFVD
ncbi:hypothetical protein AgCh_021010 [Apium graveolens]